MNSLQHDEHSSTSDKERNIYIIDDDVDIRKSVHFLLKSFDILAWSFSTSEDFLGNLPNLAPAPILLDIRMPGMDGLELLEELRARGVAWPVIMITAHGDIATAVKSLKLGACDFLEKPFAPDALERALEHSFGILDRMNEGNHLRQEAGRLLDSLSIREREVVSILINGASNKSAALRLGLSSRTVEMHRKNALRKLGVKTVVEISALVLAAGKTV